MSIQDNLCMYDCDKAVGNVSCKNHSINNIAIFVFEKMTFEEFKDQIITRMLARL